MKYLLVAAFAAAVLVDASALGQQRRPSRNTSSRQTSSRAGVTEKIKGFSKEARNAAASFTLAKDIEAALFAAEPLLANPVALSVDHRGRVYVCETYRIAKGVEDNRDHVDWIDDDLAAQTVEDRLKFFRKHLNEGIELYTSYEDRIRLLADRNGDGQADFARVFADGFKGVLEGVGAGVLAHGDSVYYTCIPNLWILKDEDANGRADERNALHYGYGVRVSLFGHDLHGLCIGNDGRLYYSIGDRGFHVETKEGTISNPETGAVFRCELDGSDLEVFAYGLRNPQDLAFDENGMLFTGDNNSDSGDEARWVHVLEGGDSGWRMAYQYLPDRGPWNRDRLWEADLESQPAYIVPPVANIADGPAGVAYYPGTGLPKQYLGNFFLCDFRAQPQLSGIRTFKMKPRGASFELIDSEIFAWNCLPTDCEFGPDGNLYTVDWIEGWDGTGKGRVFRYFNKEAAESKATKEVQKFLGEDHRKLKVTQLTRLMAHPDLRLRRVGQFELARREQLEALLEVALSSKIQLARMHALWGLGQIVRTGRKYEGEALVAAKRFIQDVDPQIRRIALNIVGDARATRGAQAVIDALDDPDDRVKSAAAIALGRMRRSIAVGPLVQMLAANADNDRAVRHAGIMGLVGCADQDQLARLDNHTNRSVRLAAVVALRRLKSERITRFLGDDSERVAGEAMRAIYDEPIAGAMQQLADAVERPISDLEAMRRTLAANYRLGKESHAVALAQFAADERHDPALRAEAVNLLRMWQSPSSRDPILGMWRPLPAARKADVVIKAIEPVMESLVTSQQLVRAQFARLASEYKLEEAAVLFAERVFELDRSGKERAGMLMALGSLAPEDLPEIISRALDDDEPRVRATARVLLSNQDPEGAVPVLVDGFQQGNTFEKQSAAAVLARLSTARADQALKILIQAYAKDQLSKAIRLDVMEAVGRRAAENPELQAQIDDIVAAWPRRDRLAPFRDAMHGGDAARGEELFFERVQLECSRCHQVGGRGGQIGPALDAIGQQSREYLLESIIEPNKSIAKGFESVILETDDGKVVSGIVAEKNDEQVFLLQSDGKLVTVDIESIEDQRKGQSAMPADLVDKMNVFDLRDILEYLAQLNAKKAE